MANETRIEAIINGDSIETLPKGEDKAERLVSIDFIRGFAIFIMVILHSFLRMTNLDWAFDFSQLFSKNIAIIIIVILLGYLGTFAGLFLLISITVNVFSAHKKLNKGISPNKILLKQLLVGVMVLAIAYLTEMVLCHEGLLGRTIIYNDFLESTPGLDKFTVARRRGFHFETLHAIGWAIILMGILHYFIVLRPLAKNKDNIVRTLVIYFTLFVIICAVSDPLHNFIENRYDGFPGLEGEDYGGKQWELPPNGVGDVFLRLFLVVIAGNLEPMFPYLATAILGAVLGYLLVQKKPPKRLPLWIFVFSVIVLIPGVVISIVVGDLRLTYSRPTIDYYFITLFGQLVFIAGFLFRVEFRGHTKWFTKITRYWRRWGVISLSIYSFEVLGTVPRWLVHWIFGWDTHIYQGANEWQTIITAIFVVAFWEGIIRLWELVNFIGSWEWIIASLSSLGKGLPPSSRLNIKRILYNVEPITFKGMWN